MLTAIIWQRSPEHSDVQCALSTAMIRFGFLALLFSVCLDCVSSQKPCDGVLGQQFRPDPADCRVYYLCGQGKDWRLQCGPNTVWSQEIGACVPVGSPEDTCTQSRHFLVLQLKVKVFFVLVI